MASNMESMAGDDLRTALMKNGYHEIQAKIPEDEKEQENSKSDSEKELTREDKIQAILDAGFISDLSEEERLKGLDDASLDDEFQKARGFAGELTGGLEKSTNGSNDSEKSANLESGGGQEVPAQPNSSQISAEQSLAPETENTITKVDPEESHGSKLSSESNADSPETIFRPAEIKKKKKAEESKLSRMGEKEKLLLSDLEQIAKGKMNAEDQEVQSQPENSPKKEVPPGPEELREKMLEIAAVETPGWEKVDNMQYELGKKFGVKVIRGFISPEEHVAAFEKLEPVLENLQKTNPKALEGLEIKVDQVEKNAFRPDVRKFVFVPGASTEEMGQFMAKELQVKAPEKLDKPEPELTAEIVKNEPEPDLNENNESLKEFRSESDIAAERALEEKLSNARLKYVAAKRKYDEYGAVQKLKSKAGFAPKKEEVFNETETLKLEYEHARQEYVGANIEKHLTEKLAMAASHKEVFGQMEAGWWKAVQGKWDKYMGLNLGHAYTKRTGKELNLLGKVASVPFSVRTVVYSGLTFMSLGAAAAAVSGVDAAFRTRRIIDWTRNKFKEELTDDKIAELNLEGVQEKQGQMLASAYFDKKSHDEIVNSEQFQKLLAHERKLLEQEGFKPDDLEFLRLQAISAENKTDLAITKEKNIRRVTTAGSVLVGVATAGLFHSMLEYVDKKYKLGWTDQNLETEMTSPGSPEPVEAGDGQVVGQTTPDSNSEIPDTKPETTAGAKVSGAEPARILTEAERSTTQFTNSLEVPEGSGKSIESVMIDHVKNNPDSPTAKWLTEKYPGTDYKTAIHKRILEIAKENGYSVDGTGKDLSDIVGAKIDISADGSFNLDKGSLDFAENIPTKSEVLESVRNEVGNVDQRVAGRIGPENVEVEKLDFDRIKESGDFEVTQTVESAAGKTAEHGALVSEEEVNKLYSQIESQKKTTDAIKDLMGGTKYKDFMKEMNLDGKDLNKIQDQKMSDFMTFFTSDQISDRQISKYKGFADRMNDLFYRSSNELGSTMKQETVKKFMVRLAAERMKQ